MNDVYSLVIASKVATGLMAGLYVGWAISVLPGLALLSDSDYLNAFQKMNRAILNSWFKILFFAALLVPLAAAIVSAWQKGMTDSFGLMMAAFLLVMGHGVITVLGNIPINEKLDKLDLSNADAACLSAHRALFERNWRVFHWGRTLATSIAFGVLLFV